MNRRVMFVLVVLCMFAVALGAQQPSKPAAKQPEKAAAAPAKAPEMPKPGPEHKRLAYWVGKWTGTGETKASPFGPGGKMSWSDTTEWMPGGFYLLTRSDAKGPMGNAKGMAFMGYDPEEKAYTYYAVSSMGYAILAKGTITGDTWNWMTDSKMGGKPMKSRFIAKELPPNGFSFKFEMSQDGGKTWNTVEEGKATKAAKAAK